MGPDTGCLRHSRGRQRQHDCSRSLAIIPNHFLLRPANLQQDGEHLFLQRKECPPDRLNKDVPRSLVPRQRQGHSGPVQVLHRRGPRKDLPFGQQHVRGIFPRENQYQSRLSKSEVYFSHPDLLRPNSPSQPQLLRPDHGPHHHGRRQRGTGDPLQMA